MLNKLVTVEKRFEEVNAFLCTSDVASDMEKYTSLMKELKQLTPIVEKYDIRIYPNPAKDYIFLETDNNTSTQVFIYNIQGVLSDSFEFDTAVYRYSIANYLAGVYTLMMINDGNIAVKKLLIIK